MGRASPSSRIRAAACTVRGSSPSGSTMRFVFRQAFSQTFSIMLMPVPSMDRQNVTPSKPCQTFLPVYVMAVAWPRSTFKTASASASCSISPG